MSNSYKVVVSTDNGTSIQQAVSTAHALIFVDAALNEIDPGRVVIVVEPPR